MRLLTFLILFSFLIGCKNSSQKESASRYDDSSHKQETEALKAFNELQKVLDTLYSLSSANSKKALLLADKYINLYTDTIKKREFYANEIEDLHYFKGEIFYQLGMYRESLNEFKSTPVNGNIAIASNYMKLKMYDSAYTILAKESPGYYLYDYVWANYYEMIGKRDKAIKLYRNILEEEWISNGNYEKLKNNTKTRLDLVLSKREVLNDLHFPTNNPRIRNSN